MIFRFVKRSYNSVVYGLSNTWYISKISRLLSGTYPTTSNIIPKDFNIELECKFDDLFNMIDRASLLTSDREYCKTYIN